MTEDGATTPEPISAPEVPTQRPDPTPIKPITLAAALIIAGVIVYNLRLDAMSDSYDGSKVTYALVFGMLFILGVDLSRFWPGGRGK